MIQNPIVDNLPVVEEDKQEDPRAEPLRKQFRKLYNEKYNLTEDQRYLAHALLQTALYHIKQVCLISLETTKGCINDGMNAAT